MTSSPKRQESLEANTQKKQIYPLMRPANSKQTMSFTEWSGLSQSKSFLVFSGRKKKKKSIG